MRRTSPDVASLVAGVVLVTFGGVLLADATGAIELTFAVLAPIVCAAVGAVLLALGLTRQD